MKIDLDVFFCIYGVVESGVFLCVMLKSIKVGEFEIRFV